MLTPPFKILVDNCNFANHLSENTFYRYSIKNRVLHVNATLVIEI